MATLADHLVRFGTHVNQTDPTIGRQYSPVCGGLLCVCAGMGVCCVCAGMGVGLFCVF